MRVTRIRPELSAPKWMGCPRSNSTQSNEVYDDERRYKEPLTSAASKQSTQFILSLSVAVLLVYISFF